MVSSLKVAVVAAIFAQARSIRVVKTRADSTRLEVNSDVVILDAVVPSGDIDTVFAEVGHSTYDEELQSPGRPQGRPGRGGRGPRGGGGRPGRGGGRPGRPGGGGGPNTTAGGITSDQARFKKDINNYRKSLGLGQLCYNSALNTAAKEYAELLFRHNLSARHDGPDGSCHSSRTVAAGYCYNRVGECGGGGRKSVEHMFIGWKNSPTHDRVMKGKDYVEMGMWCNPRSFDPKYRCFLLMAKHNSGKRCCVEDGCRQKKENKCCGSSSNYPNRSCRQCCSKNKKFPFCR